MMMSAFACLFPPLGVANVELDAGGVVGSAARTIGGQRGLHVVVNFLVGNLTNETKRGAGTADV